MGGQKDERQSRLFLSDVGLTKGARINADAVGLFADCRHIRGAGDAPFRQKFESPDMFMLPISLGKTL